MPTMPGSDDLVAAAIIVLARQGIPPDVQEMLLRGDGRGTVPPGALAAAMSAALASRDKEIERLTKELDEAKRLLDLTREYVKPMLHRWNIERQDDGDLLVCQNNHEKGDKCDYERWVPEALAATATSERDEARRYCSAAYHDLVGLFETIKDRQDLFPRTTHDLIETSEFMRLAAEGKANGAVYDDELSKEKAHSDTLERERDEARAECERLRPTVIFLANLADCFNAAPDSGLAYISVGNLRMARAALHPEGAKDGQS